MAGQDVFVGTRTRSGKSFIYEICPIILNAMKEHVNKVSSLSLKATYVEKRLQHRQRYEGILSVCSWESWIGGWKRQMERKFSTPRIFSTTPVNGILWSKSVKYKSIESLFNERYRKLAQKLLVSSDRHNFICNDWL